MRKIKFKKGDWVFADFKLMMIEYEIKQWPGKYSIRDWCVSTSSSHCYPLTLKNQAASDHISSIQKELFDSKTSLNFPDIKNQLVAMWVRMIESKDEKTMYDESNQWMQIMRKAITENKSVVVSGINIFK